MQKLFDLTGKVALVTGSTKGIGLAVARRLAEHGAKVVISSRKEARCQEVLQSFQAAGHEAMAQPCDILKIDDLERLASAVEGRWGGVDILVCNAAINPFYGPSDELPDEMFDRVLHANVKSVHQLSRRLLPGMAGRGGGSLVAISSVAGLYGSDKLGIYAVSKAAELQLIRNIAVEWGARGIRANSIAPSIIKTDFAKVLWSNPALLALRTSTTPLGRIGEPDEVAGVAVFLASAASAYMTGQTLVVDGGRSIGSGVPAREGDSSA